MTVTLTVNGHPLEVHEGASVLDAINQSGAYISQLCKDPDMKPIENVYSPSAGNVCSVLIPPRVPNGAPSTRSH